MREILLAASISSTAVYATAACATSVLQAGAFCDGHTDDSTAIVNAVSCANGGGCTGGGVADGIVDFPSGSVCVFGAGTLTLSAGAGTRLVLEGGSFPAPGANTGLNGATMGSVFLFGPGAQVQLGTNTGIKDLAFLPAAFFQMSLSGTTTNHSTTVSLSSPLSYASGGYVFSAAAGMPITGTCLGSGNTATFNKGDMTLTLASAASCSNSSATFSLGFHSPTLFAGSKAIVNQMVNITPPPIVTPGVLAFGSTATGGTNNTTIENVVVIGADTCLDARSNNNSRFNWRHLYFDCNNGILLGGTGDQGEIADLHLYPYLNSSNPPRNVAITNLGSQTSTGGVYFVAAGSFSSLGLAVNDTIEVTGAGSDPGPPVSGYPKVDGKWTIATAVEGGGNTTFTILGPANVDLPMHPTITPPQWSDIGASSNPVSVTASLAWERNRQGQGFHYDGSSLSGAGGNKNHTSGLKLTDVTVAGWGEAIHITHADHQYVRGISCTDPLGGDPYAVCLALDDGVTSFDGLNLSSNGYAIALMNLTEGPNGVNNATSLIDSLAINSSHAAPYSIVDAGGALSIGNIRIVNDGTETNIGMAPTWPAGCASNTLACATDAGKSSLLGQLVINGGVMASVGTTYTMDPTQLAQLTIGSGTAIIGPPSTRGLFLPAPWNDEGSNFVDVTGSGPVVFGAGVARVESTQTAVLASQTVQFPPNPNLGDRACFASNWGVTAMGWKDASGNPVMGLPGSLIRYKSVCVSWSGPALGWIPS